LVVIDGAASVAREANSQAGSAALCASRPELAERNGGGMLVAEDVHQDDDVSGGVIRGDERPQRVRAGAALAVLLEEESHPASSRATIAATRSGA
jgi:hypothetical protein